MPIPASHRGQEFAFINHGLEGRVEMVRWGFELRPVAPGTTEVTQTWQVLPDYADGLGVDDSGARDVLEMMQNEALQGMPRTLAALKADAEGASSSRS